MNKRIIWIVLTGGPCAGKSTALSVLKSKLTDLGYSVLLAQEIATFLIMSGIKPGNLSFQEDVLDMMQLYEEVIARNAARSTNSTTIVLCDRGQMDGMAYVEEAAFRELLAERKQSIVSLRDRYEAVIFMDSAALGAEEFYSLANNEARYESREQAVITNEALKRVWHGHEHLRVVDNSTDFQKKVDRVIALVYQLIGIPIPIEDERKYLIDPDFTRDMIPVHHVTLHVVQHYLDSEEKDVTERVRKKGQDGVYAYYHNLKRPLGPGKNDERQRIITEREYLECLERQDSQYWPVDKQRTCFLFENQYFEFDQFDQSKGRFMKEGLLEIELTAQQTEVKLPSFMEKYIIRDVTGEEAYLNVHMAMKHKP